MLGERLHEAVVELGCLHGLPELHREVSGRLCLRQPAQRGQQDEGELVLVTMPADLAREGEAVHLRHHQVEDGDVEALAVRDPDERLGRGRDRHGVHAP